ncbi:MAG: LPS export ABC transporter permease LptF [Gammaproteobacteria bacterium]
MIITRYLARQVLLTTAALTFILLVVVVLGRLLRYLAQASQGELDPAVLLLLMAYRTPDFLQLILPLALLLGILLAYGRMYAESEMTVLNACGVSSGKLLRITLVPVLGIGFVVAALALWVTPRGLVNTAALIEAQKDLNEFDVLVPGLFLNIGRGTRTTYAETSAGGELRGVFMHQAEGNRVIFAESAVPLENAEGQRFIQFRNGSFAEGTPGTDGFEMTTFGEFGVRLPQREIAFDVVLEEEALPTSALLSASAPAQVAELQWRVSLVLLIPVMALLAVPLSRVSPREGRFARIVPAILVYIVYFALLLAARDRLAEGELPPVVGLWWIHLLFIAGGWALFTGRLALPGRNRHA